MQLVSCCAVVAEEPSKIKKNIFTQVWVGSICRELRTLEVWIFGAYVVQVDPDLCTCLLSLVDKTMHRTYMNWATNTL